MMKKKLTFLYGYFHEVFNIDLHSKMFKVKIAASDLFEVQNNLNIFFENGSLLMQEGK